jgi:hypothetical protein
VSPYDAVLADSVTGYGEDALEDRATQYGTDVALATGGRPKGVSELFATKVALWVERNKNNVNTSIENAVVPMLEIYRLMEPGEDDGDKIKKAVGSWIGQQFLEAVGGAAKTLAGLSEILGKGLDFVLETEKEERLDRERFRTNYLRLTLQVKAAVVREVQVQAGSWLRQVRDAKDKAAEEAKITPLLSENNDFEIKIITQEVQLSRAMKTYWDIQVQAVYFEHPAGQPIDPNNPVKQVSPLKPRNVQNFAEVLKAIKAGDRRWNSIQKRKFVIKWSSASEKSYEPETAGRKAIEDALVAQRKLLEDAS